MNGSIEVGGVFLCIWAILSVAANGLQRRDLSSRPLSLFPSLTHLVACRYNGYSSKLIITCCLCRGNMSKVACL